MQSNQQRTFSHLLLFGAVCIFRHDPLTRNTLSVMAKLNRWLQGEEPCRYDEDESAYALQLQVPTIQRPDAVGYGFRSCCGAAVVWSETRWNCGAAQCSASTAMDPPDASSTRSFTASAGG
jgi:hypothetical protein